MKRILSLFLCLILACLTGCGDEAEMIVVNKNSVAKETPDDFKVFSIELGGMEEQQLKDALRDAVENYFITVTIDGFSFPISGAELGMKFNEALDLDDAPERIAKGTLSAADIEKELFDLDESTLPADFLAQDYYSYLQYTIEDAKEDIEAAKTAEEEARKAAESDKKDQTDESAESPENLYREETLSDEDIKSLEEKLGEIFGSTKAHIEYSKKKKAFESIDGEDGERLDFSASEVEFLAAVKTMQEKVSLSPQKVSAGGEKAEDSDAIKAALERANKYLELEIIYNFNPPEGKGGRETISSGNILTYIFVAQNGLDIEVDEDALSVFSTSLSNKYSQVEVKETDNGDETVTISRKGWETQSSEIYENLLRSLTDCTSDTYEATYKEVDEEKVADKGDIYVLVDLTAQTVYLYEGGIAVFSTPCVSGKVSAGNYTPAGTFEIYSKETNRTLKGRGYSSFVKYWMPFDGNRGLHDASWRGSFGGDIYVYNGSHGCVNLPRSAAKYLFSKVKVGTKVIVTGGLSSLKDAASSSSGSSSSSGGSDSKTTTAASAAPTITAPVPSSQAEQSSSAEPSSSSETPPESSSESEEPSSSAEESSSNEESGESE